jgi:hypothetical protein
MGRTWLPLLLLPISCYNPSYSGRYACTPATVAQDCPDGWLCHGGSCESPGAADANQGMELPPGPPHDLSGAPLQDLSAPPPPDMTGTGGCTRSQGGSPQVSIPAGYVWPCDGDFDPGDYDLLCNAAAGYHLCGENTNDAMLLPSLQFGTMSGFYLVHANITVDFEGPAKFIPHCDNPVMGLHAVLGWGSGPGVVTLEDPGCQGLTTAILCTDPPPDWSCDPDKPMGNVSHHAKDGRPGGVLCCNNKR